MSYRIAILCSNLLPVDPDPSHLPSGFSGAAERVMYRITEGMVRRGYDVTLFASGDSKTSAKLTSIAPLASINDPKIGLAHHIEFEHLLISDCYRKAKLGEFDIIHSAFDTRSAFYAGLVSTPTISTLHSPLEHIRHRILLQIPSTQHYVSISDSQRRLLPELQYVGTVYHGIELDSFRFSESGGEAMMWAGRITPTKGVHLAAGIANELNKPLVICGTFEPMYQTYWDHELLPFIDHTGITWNGMMRVAEIIATYGSSKLFIMPIQWEEPFGLVLIESMSCGTPVVAFARGSTTEIIEDGVTGYLVNPSDDDIRGDWLIKSTGIKGLQEAVDRIYHLSSDEYRTMRRACRERVERLFTVEKMVQGYEALYTKLLTR